MSSTWTGAALLTRFYQKYGFSDSTSQLRVLEWMNEIQEDICASHNWPFMKMKMKKYIAAGVQDFTLSPQIPSAPTIALLAGGSLTADTEVSIKVTFEIFPDASNREYDSIESEASVASNAVTPTGSDLSITITGLDTFDGDDSVYPVHIHRKIYLKVGDGDYYLAKTVSNNTATSTTITANTTSVIEPPEYSMVDAIAPEDLLIEGSGQVLYQNQLNDIINYDPNLTQSGTPQYHARLGAKRVFIYPKPSAAITISYWIYRKPARIFNDSSRVIQLEPALKKVLDAGVTWKSYEYKDQDGTEGKLQNYEMLKSDAAYDVGKSNNHPNTVQVVC